MFQIAVVLRSHASAAPRASAGHIDHIDTPARPTQIVPLTDRNCATVADPGECSAAPPHRTITTLFMAA